MPNDPLAGGDPLGASLEALTARIAALEGSGPFAPGMIGWTAGTTAPPGWLIADGTAYDTDRYAALFAVLGSANLPNLVGRFAMGAGTSYALGSAGGGTGFSLSVANLPSHAHTIGGSTGTEAAHTHSGTTGNDAPDHNHSFASLVAFTTASAQVASGASYAAINSWGYTTGGASARHQHAFNTGAGSSHSHTLPANTGEAGSGTAVGILNPYLALTPLCHI